MQTRALVCDDRQEFSLADVLLPDPNETQMLVRTLYSGVSIGTEFALIRNKLSWGPYPLCTGYQGAGVVEWAGECVQGFKAGDRVYYRDNRIMTLPDGARISCVCGTHCGHALIDPANTGGVALMPAGVPADVGSLFVMPAVGLFGVDMANARMGDTVVVFGTGLIGLGVLAACVHRGCTVIAVDLCENRLAVARELGADHTINGTHTDTEAAVKEIVPEGADVVFECTGIPALIDEAIPLCRGFGKFVWQGNYGKDPFPIHFLPSHGRRLTMFFPCDDGFAPCRRAVLKNITMDALKWERVITHRASPEEAVDLFDRINRDEAEDVVGAVVHWSD